MMPSGVQAKELAIQHVGEPRQRMPIRGVKRCTGPNNPLEGQPIPDHWVLIHITVIIEIDELTVHESAIDCEGGENQGREEKYFKRKPAQGRWRTGSFLPTSGNMPDRRPGSSADVGLLISPLYSTN